MNPWLSVIVPVFNGERYLADALESVVAQDDGGIEVIAVDDGSTDRSVEILRSFTGRIPMRLELQRPSGNWVATTNRALALARGTYVAMLHQDDLWLPGRLARVREVVQTHPGIDLILSAATFVDSEGGELGSWTCPLPSGRPIEPGGVVEPLLVQNFVPLPSATFRRQAAIECGGLDEGLWYTADWDLWLKIASSGSTFYLAERLACFRVHEGSQTAKRSVSPDFRTQLETVLDRHLEPAITRRVRSRGRKVEHAARFSIELNLTLAALSHGRSAPIERLAASFLALGPLGWRRYLRSSRIVERAGARVRARARASAPRRPALPGALQKS